ncbi:MAG: hypothetical protein LQ338_006346 [Usnochroma carphineum]|nr:MAG: hypothetical protein LQ338_006346 [Usnochroma carphineum]
MDKAGLEVQSLSEVHSNELERRQGAVIAAALIGSWGIGQITGRYTQWRRDVAAVTPGLNNAQGSACHQSGTWFSTADITSAIEHGCEMLGTQSVMWLRMGNERFKNPRYTAASRGDGSGFFDKQGNKITITMTAWNENGKAAVDWINHQACVLAMQTILYDCRGWNPDTRGGSFFYGSDGVAGYSLDPNCVNSPGKPCPRPGA